MRKRSQEQHPRARYAFHAQTAWVHQDLGNPFNVHVKRTSSSVPGSGRHIASAN